MQLEKERTAEELARVNQQREQMQQAASEAQAKEASLRKIVEDTQSTQEENLRLKALMQDYKSQLEQVQAERDQVIAERDQEAQGKAAAQDKLRQILDQLKARAASR